MFNKSAGLRSADISILLIAVTHSNVIANIKTDNIHIRILLIELYEHKDSAQKKPLCMNSGVLIVSSVFLLT